MGNQPSTTETKKNESQNTNLSSGSLVNSATKSNDASHIYTKMSPEEYKEYQDFLAQKKSQDTPPPQPSTCTHNLSSPAIQSKMTNPSFIKPPVMINQSLLDKDILDKLNRKPQASLRKSTAPAPSQILQQNYASAPSLKSSLPDSVSISSLVEVPPPQPRGGYSDEFYSRPKPQLSSRTDHSSVKDDYQNLWAQRQLDVNQTHLSALKTHGEIKKNERHFEKTERQRNTLRTKNSLEYLDRVDFDNIQTDSDFQVCYRFLGIQLPTNKHELTDAFKKKAKIHHPDKGGSKLMFDRLKKAFVALLKKHHTDKDFHELQQSSRQEIEKKYSTCAPEDAPLGRGEQFDLKKFHKLYETHSLKNNYDEGYEEWRKNESTGYSDKAKQTCQKYKLDPKKFNKGNFNSAFQNLKQEVLQDKPQSKQLMRIEEPEALVSSSSGFSEIDQAPIGDFTTSSGGIQGTDYKRAMTETYLVPKDTSIFQRKQFKDLKELEKDRENIRYTLNDDEISQFLAKKEKEEEAEQQRLHRIRERDELVKESYQNIHNLLGL